MDHIAHELVAEPGRITCLGCDLEVTWDDADPPGFGAEGMATWPPAGSPE